MSIVPADLHDGTPGAAGGVPDAVPGRVAGGLAQQADGAVPPSRAAARAHRGAPD